jgi:hypothetical protein
VKSQFEEHLSPLLRGGRIDPVWSDDSLTAGTEFDTRIRQTLEESDLILLLLSPSFVNSDYCWNIELHRALERHDAGHARAVFVLIRAVNWGEIPRIKKYTIVPRNLVAVASWPNIDEAFTEVVKEVERVIKEIEDHLTHVLASPDGQQPDTAELVTGGGTQASDTDSAVFHCRVHVDRPTVVRTRGLTELVSDVVLQFCGNPGERRFADVWIYLNTNLTSRLVGSGNLSEAMLSLATARSIANLPALRRGIRAVQSAANALAFLHVPLHELGSLPESERNLRISGIRVNAFQLGFSPRAVTHVHAHVTVSDTTVIPSPLPPVASVAADFQFTVSPADSGVSLSRLSQAAPANAGMLAGSGMAERLTALLTFSGRLASVELPNERTRLLVHFLSVLRGVELFVKTEHLAAAPSGLSATLTQTNLNGNGILQIPKADAWVSVDGRSLGLARVDVAGGSGHAAWELDGGLLEEHQEIVLGVVLAYPGDSSAGMPALGTTLVQGMLAPLSNAGTASATDPVPRFANASSLQNFFTIVH